MIRRKLIIAMLVVFALSQQSFAIAKIVGKVTDQFDRGLGNVHIEIENTGFESWTNENGDYSIDYIPGKIKLRFTKDGYTTSHLELDIYVKDKFPAKKISIWKIPPDGIYVVDKENKKYLRIDNVFKVKVNSKMHRDNKSMKNLQMNLNNIDNLASLNYYADEIGSFHINNGTVTVVDTVPNSIILYKVGNSGKIMSLQQGAFGKIGGVIFDGRVKEDINNIGDEKLTVRSFEAKDGIYVFSQVKKISDGFGTTATVPSGIYYPIVAGKPQVKIKTKKNNASSRRLLTKKQKDELAFGLVLKTLNSGTVGAEKRSFRHGKPILGVVVTDSYNWGVLRKFPCKKYKVISYESGKPTVIADQGNACRAEGKWYPYKMFKNPSKAISKQRYKEMIIGY